MEYRDDIPCGRRKESQKPYSIRRKPISRNTLSYEPIHIETSSGTTINNDIWRPREEINLIANAEPEFSNTSRSIEPSSKSQNSTSYTHVNASHGLLKATENVKVAGIDEESNHKGYVAASWRPTWLHPLGLALFASLFLFLSVALAAMLWYSNTNNGLFESRQSLLHTYLWRFGPTAFLTILTIFWARVELQAMMYMPWISLRSGPSLGESDLALDYTTMLLPLVFSRSFRRRHYLVFLVASISALLKVQIILAPGLYSLTGLQVTRPIGILLQDTFDSVTPETTYTPDASVYYRARAQYDFNVDYPYGVAEGFAFQTFYTGSDFSRGTVANPVTATVGGLFLDTQCVKLNSYAILEQHNIANYQGRGLYMNFTVKLQFDGCEEPVIVPHFDAWPSPRPNATFWGLQTDSKVGRPCSGLPLQAPAFLYYNGVFKLRSDNSSEYLHPPAAVICEPQAWLTKVQVTDDGVKPKVMAVYDEQRPLSTPNIMTMFNNSLPPKDIWHADTVSGWTGPLSVDLRFRGHATTEFPEVVTTDMLQDSSQNITRRLGPFASHYHLRQKESTSGSGTSLQRIVRLTINPKICLAMIALFIFNAGITAFLLWRYYHYTSVWHRDPATLLGSTMFLSNHHDITNRAAEIKGPSPDWNSGAFTPLVLKTTSRVVFCIFTMLLASSLVVTLRHSETSNGLATIEEDGYLHLMWTSFPATIALAVSLYISSCDWSYRDLATLYQLSRATCNSCDLDRSLLDMLGLRALYYSFRYRLWSVTVSQSLALVCGVLTSLVSIIFTVEVIPGSTPAQFQQKTWFQIRDNVGYELDYTAKQEMFNGLWTRREEGSLTYPENTFDNLLFHDFESIDTLDPSKNLSVAIKTPATKVESQCTQLSEDTYDISHYNTTATNGRVGYYAAIVVRFCDPGNDKPTRIKKDIDLGKTDPADPLGSIYFSGMIQTQANPVVDGCMLESQLVHSNLTTALYPTYVWGAFDPAQNNFSFVAVWTCKYSWVEVDAETNLVFSDGRLAIDPENPPRPDMASMRPLDPTLDLNTWFAMYPEVDLGGTGDQFKGVEGPFRPLIKPYGTLDLSAFGDEGQQADVMQNIYHNYALSSAQLANVVNRKPITAESGPSPAPVVEATVYDNGRRRLVQNPTITYVVVGILGAVILFNIWALISASIRRCGGGNSWLLDMDARGLAPDGFRSIAAAASLLRNSNAAAHLPPGSEMMSSDEVHGHMHGLGFRLGWFRRECDQTRHYTVGVMGDPAFNYMGVRRSSKRASAGSFRKESVLES
ncbi:uncharacterized protein BDZ83DRAFT_577605 [Colletotrichum acutatum]|uniref:Uncharacterized protein n=1 Tax=Glomerella acutata TaxID=27357 RepID=A0AAD8UPD3_GLOAC|nr:uncharacterized protein BDZ83DRAFT_577605 [Colletotrichum acutatum]KAK1724946.1 hypothetical protein BDZ83DRAFT_577605 [Colletotrichum acutatum]